MTKRKLKPFVMPTLYVLSITTFILSIYLIQRFVSNTSFKESNNDLQYVDNEIFNYNQYIPVVSTGVEIKRPYLDENIKIVKNYYDINSDEQTQENSLIYYENTYMQNSGIDYKGSESFDVISILDGTVVSVKEDNILGTTIEIRHTNDLISVYQSVKDIKVKEKDVVLQGQIIATSGSNNINKDLEDHLHFEMYYKGQIVNPENYFGKKLEEL